MHKPLIATIVWVLLAGAAVRADGILGVGNTQEFPKPQQSGAAIDFQLWQWPKDAPARKELAKLDNGARIAWEPLRGHGMQICFRIAAPHDCLTSLTRSSDSFVEVKWGPEKVKPQGSDATLYHTFAAHLPMPPQVGRYYVEVEATLEGKPVAKRSIAFDLIHSAPTPRNTQYLAGKKDCKGNPITGSAPVELQLNETPLLKDNDYSFEPQHAYNVINFARFPPFSLPKRFIAVWNSRRFTDESNFGGPLDRGFTSLATVKCEQDNLLIGQRAWFHTPDQQVAFIHEWLKKEPGKYDDLKAYADHRSAFVSAESAYQLGWRCYESWGAGGFGPYDPGLYGWDEEQMWPTIAVKLLKEHPELVPEKLRKLKEKDPELKDPNILGQIHWEYIQAWGDFVGNTYRGARDCAAKHGRVFKVWHYGSKAPGEHLFLGPDDAKLNPATGQYRYEEIGALWPWFRRGSAIDYAISEYARQIDYFHKDFYYHTLFAEKSSMYEKDAQGNYRLDPRGRRKIRKDVFEETVYVDPVKIGHEDCEVGPAFLKAFIAKGENALYWLNGGKYPKKHGTAVTDKQLIPALRPGNQETWGECAKLGSRPVNPYLAEAAAIYTYMMGLEGLYLWDARLFTGPAGFGPNGDAKSAETLGDMEFIVKGMHRVSQLNALFEGDYSYVRPVRHYDTWNRDHPLIRGIQNGRWLALAMTNPYLDPGEEQEVEIWYDAPHADIAKSVWSGKVKLQSRKTHLFQCQLPPLPSGQHYDPDRLYFRYTCIDGSFKQTFTVTGNYDLQFPYPEP